MPELDLKLWRDRLRWAKDTWMRQGLIGTRSYSSMRVLIELYRGNQWRHIGDWAGVSGDDQATINKVFPIANSVVGEVSARNPQVEIFPANPDSARAAPGVERLINRDMKELRWQRQVNDVLADHLFAPFAVLRHGFTPEAEFESERGRRLELYGGAKPDRPWVKREPIWNVLLDPRSERFHNDSNMRWVAFRSVMTLAQIRDNPNMIARDKLKDFAGTINRDWVEMMPTALQETHKKDPDQNELVEVYTVYEKENRTCFQITLEGPDRALREPDDWPLPWEDLPVSILSVNDQRDTPFPVPLMDPVIRDQVLINKLWTMASILARQMRRVVFYNNNALAPDEEHKLDSAELVEFIKCNASVQDVMGQVTVGGGFEPLLLAIAQVEENIRETVGQSRMGRGQRINVETAHEVERVQQGQDIHTSRIAHAFEEFNEHAVRLYMQARRSTMEFTGPEVMRSVGQRNMQGVQEWIRVSPEDMAGDFEIQVQVGSTRPKDRDREAQKALADLQVGATVGPSIANVAAFLTKYLEERGLDPMRFMRPGAEQAALLQALDETRRTVGEEGAATPDPAAVAASLQAQGGNGVAG